MNTDIIVYIFSGMILLFIGAALVISLYNLWRCGKSAEASMKRSSKAQDAYYQFDELPIIRARKTPDLEKVVFARPKLIDPKKLLETRFPCVGNDGEDTLVRLRDVITAIEQAPDEVIVECASWVGERGEWTCSNCGESAPLDGYLDSKYCYGCGRIMVNSSKLEERDDIHEA